MADETLFEGFRRGGGSDRAERAEELFREGTRAQSEGDLERAQELYRRSIEAFPTAEAHTFLGWTYSFQGRAQDAIEECRRAIEVDPEFGNPYNDIGAYLIELGRPDEAIGWLEKAKRAKRYDPRHFPHVNLARIHAARGNYLEAIRELAESLVHLPDNPPARRELRRLLARCN